MRPEVSHEEAFAELDAIALDLVDGAERDSIMQHVSTCSTCRGELDALQETTAELAFAAPGAPDAAATRGRVRGRLMERAAADEQTRKQVFTPLVFPREVAALPDPGTMTAQRRATWMALAAGVMFVASLGLFALSFRGRQDVVDALKAQVASTSVLRHTADSLSDQLAARDSVLAGIAGRDVAMMTLVSRSAKDPYARMFWDRAMHTWTLIAHNMPALKSGRTYQLWLVTPKARISAGTFTVHGGEAVVRTTYELTEPLNSIAVTDEPAGGVAQPTGSVIIGATTATK
jgi:hypothetical protein